MLDAFARAAERDPEKSLGDDVLRSVARALIIMKAARGPCDSIDLLEKPPVNPDADTPTFRRLRELIAEEQAEIDRILV